MYPKPIPQEPGCLCMKHTDPLKPAANWLCTLWRERRVFQFHIGSEDHSAPSSYDLMRLLDLYPALFREITPKAA